MSQRAHFWLRIVGLTAILAAEFGPRIWASPPSSALTARITTSATAPAARSPRAQLGLALAQP